MHLTTLIGLRFLFSSGISRAVSIITWAAFISISLGVAAVLIVTSVLNGFAQSFFQIGTASVPHLQMEAASGALSPETIQSIQSQLRALPAVIASTHHVSRQAFIRHHKNFLPVIVRGVDAAEELQVTGVSQYVKTNAFWPLSKAFPFSQSFPIQKSFRDGRGLHGLERSDHKQGAQEHAGVVIGAVLAKRLGVGIGDRVELVSPVQRYTPIGPIPLLKKVQVEGILQTGLDPADATLVYVQRELAQRLFLMGNHSDSIAVRFADPNQLHVETLQAKWSELVFIPWHEQTRNLLQVLALEKLGLYVLLSLLIGVGFLNIVGSLTMLVLEKKNAIAILKTLGASDRTMGLVFFQQGLWLGICGTGLGLGLGGLGCWAIRHFSASIFPDKILEVFEHVPVSVHWVDLLWIGLSTFSLCLLTTLYPAAQAIKLWPITSLRET